jgi:hypothetical protein
MLFESIKYILFSLCLIGICHYVINNLSSNLTSRKAIDLNQPGPLLPDTSPQTAPQAAAQAPVPIVPSQTLAPISEVSEISSPSSDAKMDLKQYLNPTSQSNAPNAPSSDPYMSYDGGSASMVPASSNTQQSSESTPFIGSSMLEDL